MSIDTIEETSAEWLVSWDAGKEVWSVSMGGMGEGYERCIQHLAAEMIRALNEYPDSKTIDLKNSELRKALNDVLDKVADRLDDTYQFSGAQVGAAKNLAMIFHRQGPRAAMDNPVVTDRLIKVRRD